MRIHGIALLLALGGPVLAQEDEGVEVSKDPPDPPAVPKTIDTTIRQMLTRLRKYEFRGPRRRPERRQGVATEAFVLYTRAACADLRKEDRERLTAWNKEWKRAEQHEGFENPIDLAAVILALTAANADPKGKRTAPSDNPNRPPRGSRFDKNHWDLMHECVVRLTTEGALRQDMNGGWGTPADRLVTTHFVLLSLREAGRAGHPFDPRVFERAIDHVRGFAAGKGAGGPPTVDDQARAMVCAWICHEQLALADPKHPGLARTRELAERTALLDPVFRDPAQPPSIECLWTLEQFGSLTGEAILGGRNWYQEGTNRVLAATWLAKDPETTEEIYSICFALLFLKRQTAPLAAGK